MKSQYFDKTRGTDKGTKAFVVDRRPGVQNGQECLFIITAAIHWSIKHWVWGIQCPVSVESGGSDAWLFRIMITHLDWPCQSSYPHNPHSVVSSNYNQTLTPSSNQYIERNFNFKMNLIFFFHLYAMNLVKGNCQQWPFSGSFLLSKKNKIRHRHNRRKEFLPLNSLL